VLGRGLADLIPAGGKDSVVKGPTGEPLPGDEVPIATLHRNPRQPRTRFDEAALGELADSIRVNGILQPILVRPRPNGGFEIVAGERRYRAALLAGLTAVPVIVRTLTDDETLALALIENLIREDIGPLETARAFKRLMDDFGWTQEEMGRRVGKSRVAVTNSLRLLRLPEPIQISLEDGEITEGHARALVGDGESRESPDFREHQLRAWRQIRDRKLSVREAERLMRPSPAAPVRPDSASSSTGVASPHASGEGASIEIRSIQDALRTALGTKVALVGDLDRGRIEITYFSADELDGLMARLIRTGPDITEDVSPAAAPGAVVSRETPSRRRESPITGILSGRRPGA